MLHENNRHVCLAVRGGLITYFKSYIPYITFLILGCFVDASVEPAAPHTSLHEK